MISRRWFRVHAGKVFGNMPMADSHLQMHKASIAVEEADITRAGYGQAIEMYSVIDVTSNDLRYETVENLKQIRAESREND